ncbi:MAG: carbamoyltransferase HypF [Cyclobacteriaceae bacterium]
MKCIHIHIEGQVQGVGFRPFVYRLATEHDLRGWVYNGMDGVHVEVEGEAEQLQKFIQQLENNYPPIARITQFRVEEQSLKHYAKFKIVESEFSGKPNLLITPDIGLCDDCRKEVHNKQNHRYQYPFTTCTQCGPRYSIMRSLPYDRHTTSMDEFVMCPVCKQEYNNPTDRRYYSQTNSCPECTIKVSLLAANGQTIASGWGSTFSVVIQKLNAGNIIAMKGIGGYLLLCDATHAQAIETLRARKHRPTKPFALMYPDIETLKQDACLGAKEEKAFLSMQSPIVLVNVKEHPASGICKELIAPGLMRIGAMQPYTAMFELVMAAFKKPLIATSANVSGSPIIYKDDDALQLLNTIADYFVIHNREIEIAQDDSVVQFSSLYNQPIMLRRSRGFAPTTSHEAFSNETILAMGADLKSAFALQANGRFYTSQYLGDLESFESQESFRKALFHLMGLVKVKPERIVIDAHPNYYSSQLGRTLAENWTIPVTQVQHHKAHAFAIVAENNLLDTSEPVLNVIWDGTGYGDDGNSWGGEFFEYNEKSLKRIGQVQYAPVWQGDKMASDGRLAALFIGHQSDRVKRFLKNKFSDVVWQYYSRLITTTPQLFTSSVGRLFDAVACITGINAYNSFEGESAMRLETEARTGVTPIRYVVKWKNTSLNTDHLLNQVVMDMEEGIRPEKIAYKFHAWLADVIHSVVQAKHYKKVALSGGVFQNALLMDLIHENLNEKQVYVHRELSPNDENIAFGQLAYAAHETCASTKSTKSEFHVNPV